MNPHHLLFFLMFNILNFFLVFANNKFKRLLLVLSLNINFNLTINPIHLPYSQFSSHLYRTSTCSNFAQTNSSPGLYKELSASSNSPPAKSAKSSLAANSCKEYARSYWLTPKNYCFPSDFSEITCVKKNKLLFINCPSLARSFNFPPHSTLKLTKTLLTNCCSTPRTQYSPTFPTQPNPRN